jgi:hypothetical protein
MLQIRTMTLRVGLALLSAAVLSACVTGGGGNRANSMVAGSVDAEPVPGAFHYCHAHNCKDRSRLSLSEAQWQDAIWRLVPIPDTAAEERARLALAVADFERVVSRETGTGSDLGGSFAGFGQSGQLDCIDEALNMTMFLRLVQGQGLLRYHTPSSPITKGNMFDEWPHYTATMVEDATGQRYTLDSWYFDNGQPALVLRNETWRGSLKDLIACMRDGGESAEARKTPAECGYS